VAASIVLVAESALPAELSGSDPSRPIEASLDDEDESEPLSQPKASAAAKRIAARRISDPEIH